MKRRLTCILAADAVGYSSHMGNDEEGTLRVLAAHRAVIDGIIAFHEGRIVSTAGDSVLAEFGSVVEAVRCAVEIQEALKTRNDSLPENRRMLFRVGVNLGDVVVKNDDLLGDGVNVAARLETMADPGGICISSSVYDQITGKLDLGFQDIGEQPLKNISRPIRVYRLMGTAPVRVAPSAAPARPPPAPSASLAPRTRKPLPWIVGAAALAALAAAVAWQMASWRSDAASQGAVTKAAAPAGSVSPRPAEGTDAPAASMVVADAARTQSEADTQRTRADAEARKRQAEAELARTRADAETARVARARADAEATAARIRAQAEADAARAAVQAPMVRAAETPREPDAGTKAPVAPARQPAPAQDKTVVAATEARSAGFDGAWNVTVVCSVAADGAMGYTLQFVAEVKDGFLRGEYGADGGANALKLEGQIQPDGKATLEVKGATGDPKYSVKRVQSGTAYAYRVAAQFDGARGTGTRLDTRPCDLRFVKR